MNKVIIISTTRKIVTKMIPLEDIENTNFTQHIVNAGYSNIDLLHKWDSGEYDIYIYGWKNGTYRVVNKYDLPQPLTNLYYGDLIAVLKYKNKVIDFEKEDWEEFYENMFEGFDDISSEEEFVQDLDYDYSDGWLVRD